MKKNKLILIASGLGIVVLILAVVIWKAVFSAPAVAPVEEEDVVIKEVDKSVEVTLIPRSDNRAVTLSVRAIPKGTESIEYELSYDTAEGLPKGALGKIKLAGESTIDREILLGTCSRNVCKYDEGVTKINLVLRFNTLDGASQFQKEYKL